MFICFIQLDKFIATDITISQFVSPEFRYFRIHRKVVDCYAAIVYDEKSRLKEGGKTRQLSQEVQ